MGVIYSIACRDCKITRDLDKFYSSEWMKGETREDAIAFVDEVKNDAFKFGLAVSFLAKHKGHDCVFFNEHSSDRLQQELDPYYKESTEDVDFW